MIPLTIPIFYFDKGHKRSYDSDSVSDSDSVPSENQPLMMRVFSFSLNDMNSLLIKMKKV